MLKISIKKEVLESLSFKNEQADSFAGQLFCLMLVENARADGGKLKLTNYKTIALGGITMVTIPAKIKDRLIAGVKKFQPVVRKAEVEIVETEALMENN